MPGVLLLAFSLCFLKMSHACFLAKLKPAVSQGVRVLLAAAQLSREASRPLAERQGFLDPTVLFAPVLCPFSGTRHLVTYSVLNKVSDATFTFRDMVIALLEISHLIK